MPKYVDISGAIPDSVRHWYIAGSDSGIKAAAYQELREYASSRTCEAILLDGASCTTDEVIEALAEPSYHDLPRLIVLDHADEVNLKVLSSRRSSDYPAWLLAVGGVNVPTTDDADYKFFSSRQCSRLISCQSTSTSKLIPMVSRRLGCGYDFSTALVELSSGDSGWVLREVSKLALLGIGPSLMAGHAPLVTSSTSHGDLVGFLMTGSKGNALRCIPSPNDSARVFFDLEELTIKGALVYEAQKNAGWSKRALLERTGLKSAELDMLRAHINMFGKAPTERRLKALARVSKRARQGDKAAWHVLIALW